MPIIAVAAIDLEVAAILHEGEEPVLNIVMTFDGTKMGANLRKLARQEFGERGTGTDMTMVPRAKLLSQTTVYSYIQQHPGSSCC